MTVRLSLPHFPFRVGFSDSSEGSGEVQTAPGGISKGPTLSCGSAPKILGFLKTIVVMILTGGVAVSATSPVTYYACIMHAGSKASERLSGDEPDRTKKDQERIPRTGTKQKGLGANMGLETSHNSHSVSKV